MTSSHDLQRKAEQARVRLSESLGDLSNQLSPAAVVSDLLAVDYDKARQDVTRFLSKQVRGNPVAFALIAAGVGWLLISEAREPLSRLRLGRGSRPRRKRRLAKAQQRPVSKASPSRKRA